MIKAGCLCRHVIAINSCLHELQSGSMPNIPSFTSCTHLKLNKLCFQWKKPSKTRGFFLVAATTTVVPSGNTLELMGQEQNMESADLGNWGPSYSEDEKEIEPKEARRRMRISKANKGKVPWNKGRKHTPETLVRIKERTKQAMENPKIKLKVSLAQYYRAASQSKERKEEIRANLRGAWEVRRRKLLLQQTCIVEWKESIAESARRGGDGEDELHWDSYKNLREHMHLEWLWAVATSKSIPKGHRCRGAAKSAEQRQKIAGSIKAKWTDPEYRKNVMTGMHKALKRNPLMAREKHVAIDDIKREKPSRSRNHTLKESTGDRNPKDPRKKMPLSYSDPLAGAKLQMIKQIRANRAAMEMEKREATERAMLLIAEAEKAAKSLESAAIGNTSAQVFVWETRRLIDEAIHSMRTAESGKSADAPMLERNFSRPTLTDTHFTDRSEAVDPAITDCADNYDAHQPSLAKREKIYENSHLTCKSETPLRSEISRSFCHYSHEPNHPILSQKFGLSEVTGSINYSIGSEFEGISDDVSEKDAIFSVERNSMGEITTSTDIQDNPDCKGESRNTEKIMEDFISSILHNMNFLLSTEYSIHDIDGKSEVPPSQTVKYEKKKKWVRGRLIEVEED